MPVGGPGGGLAWGKGTPSSLLEAQSAWPWRRPAGPRGRRRGAAGLRGNSCRQRAGPPRAPVPRFNCCFPASPEHPVLAFGALRREPHGRPVSGGSSGGSPPVCAPSCPSGSHVGGTGLGVTETQRGTCPSVSWTRVLVTVKDALGLPGRVWRTPSRDALTRGVTDGALREKDPCFLIRWKESGAEPGNARLRKALRTVGGQEPGPRSRWARVRGACWHPGKLLPGVVSLSTLSKSEAARASW